MLLKPLVKAIRAGIPRPWLPDRLPEVKLWYDVSDIGTQLGPELINNGTFDTGIEDWTATQSALIGWNELGYLDITFANPSSWGGGAQAIQTEVGKTYLLTGEIKANTNSEAIALQKTDGAGGLHLNLVRTVDGEVGRKTVTFTATASTTYVGFTHADGDDTSESTISVDNISVREVTSTNTKLFQDVAGTTPVTDVEQPVGLMLDKSQGLKIGPELITNGTFDTATGWDVRAWTVSGGVATVTDPPSTTSYIAQTGVGTPNTYVKVEIDVLSVGTGALEIRLGAEATGAGIIQFTTLGKKTVIIPWTGTTDWLYIRGTTTSGTYTFDNVSVKEIAGHHATQSTAAARPVLSSRYNLLEKTEQFDDAYWIKQAALIDTDVTVAPDGIQSADKLIATSTNSGHNLAYTLTTSGLTKISIYAKSGEYDYVSITPNNAGNLAAWFNVSTGVVESNGVDVISATVESAENSFFKVSLTVDAEITSLRYYVGATPSYAAFIGDGTSGIYIWGASVTQAQYSNLPYQRVNTSTDYDSDFNKFPPYLRFDGIDDYMVVNGLTSGVTPITAHFGYVTNDGESNNFQSLLDIQTGRLAMFAVTDVAGYCGHYNGSTYSSVDIDTESLTVSTYNINTSHRSMKVNGATVINETGPFTGLQVTGNVSLGTIYTKTAAFLNGNLYQAILRTATSSDADIQRAETFIANKMGMTL